MIAITQYEYGEEEMPGRLTWLAEDADEGQVSL